MRNYTIVEVAEMLNVTPEQVRRWIRSGKLIATIVSKKSGYVISEHDLFMFVRIIPKYLDKLCMQIDPIDEIKYKLTSVLIDLIDQRDLLTKRIDTISLMLKGL